MPCVQVAVEIGHRANPSVTPTKEGFTHEWTVYVRAQDGSNIAHFVDKVEFHLHDTFGDHLRVVTEPPYHVSGVAYADVDLTIEIYFKNKEEPQKIRFNYNLFLKTQKPASYIRCEKLTFIKPSDEFKKLLIKAGGVYVLPPVRAQFADLCETPIQTGSLKKRKQPSAISSKVPVTPPGETQSAGLSGAPTKTVKKPKEPSTISSKVLALPPVDTQFSDLFGSPIKVLKQKQPSIISSKRQTDPKNSERKKRTGSPILTVDTIMAKKQRVHFSNITKIEQKEDLSLPMDISSESDDDFWGDLTGAADLDIIPTCGVSKSSNQNYSRSDLKQLMAELGDDSTDDDIIDTVNA
ncbi:hypothetical protein ACJMK2_043587 [Sinanodonta woodiana]|uniref:YEATS domain-containing protein n=1 Tax=Sinanodonta woodiana TaxID=1069815 RepID=A0ABD3VY62_SINWO